MHVGLRTEAYLQYVLSLMRVFLMTSVEDVRW